MAERIYGRHNSGLKTVTKAELLELLAQYDDEQLIAFSYDYGDHSHTEAIDGITRADEKQLTETAYSPSGFAVASDEDEEQEDVFMQDIGGGEEQPLTVVVLS